MRYDLGEKLYLWWVATVLVVVGAHFGLDYLGVEHAGKGAVEAVLAASLMVVPYMVVRRRVVEPLDRLRETAGMIAAGDMKARSAVESPPEFKELSDAMNMMADKVEYTYQEMVSTNLTLEKAVEARAQAHSVEHEKLSSLFNSIPDGVIFISVAGEILEINQMMGEIWGVDVGEIKGRMVEDLPEGPVRDSLLFNCKGKACPRCWEVYNCVEKECPAYMSEDVRCWLISGTYCRKGRQVSVKRKREDICSACQVYKDLMDLCSEVREVEIAGRHYKISGALVLDSAKRVTGELKTFYDVTHEKLLEKRKADFISLVTHDLKSPLTNIIGYSDLLLARGLGAEEAEYINSMHKNAARLLEMVEQYLDLTKMEAGMLELRPSVFDAGLLVEEAVMDVKVQAGQRDITADIALEDGRRTVEADRELVYRVVINLLTNAIKYGGDSIRVSARKAGDGPGTFVEISVSDNGPGIPEDDLPHIFDRYYRAPGSGAKGTGLGLAVVKSIVDAHKGKVFAGNRAGGGSEFKVQLPAGPEGGDV